MAKGSIKERLEMLKQEGLFVDEEKRIASIKLNAVVPGKYQQSGLSNNAGEDISINEDDNYLHVPVRALSEVYIQDRDIDFTQPGVIKNSSKLLLGQTVYTNHQHDVTTWVGVVVKTWYDAGSGVPAGINSTLRVNKKWNERLSDGIKDGAVHSVSVDVYFDYKKSHPDLQDFWWLLGQEVDGEKVRLIATKIISYGEISFVWQGADSFAKRLSKEGKPEGHLEDNNAAGNNNNNDEGELMKLKRKDAEKLGLTLSDFGFKAGVMEVDLDDTKFTLLMDKMGTVSNEADFYREIFEISGIKAGDESLSEKMKQMVDLAKCGEKFLKDTRSEAVKFAKLANGEKGISEALEKAINNASIEDALKFREDYFSEAEKNFPLRCDKCGGVMLRKTTANKNQSDENFNESDFMVEGV